MKIKNGDKLDFYSHSHLMDDEELLAGQKGYVTNIQRFTVHDGPGIRTEVFLKGCPLRCKWCFNPESFHIAQEIGLYSSKCIGIDKCNLCMEACPEIDLSYANQMKEEAIERMKNPDRKYDSPISSEGDIFTIGLYKERLDGKERYVISGINSQLSPDIFPYAEVCPSEAIKIWGKEMYVDQVVEEVLKEKSFYEECGGGITLSGGEILVQWKFARELLKKSKENHIHTCIESTLHRNWEIIDKILAYTDFIITDVKHMDPKKHVEYTGISNEMILENIKKVAEVGKPVLIRIPIIPNCNDSKENIKATAEFISESFKGKDTLKQVQLLRFHKLGKEKYDSIAMKWPLENFEEPSQEEYEKQIRGLAEIMKAYGLPVAVGSATLY